MVAALPEQVVDPSQNWMKPTVAPARHIASITRPGSSS
jgi:hypothetical protein